MISSGTSLLYSSQSIEAFPPAEQFREQMERAGLVDVTATPQTFATATLYTGRVPQAS